MGSELDAILGAGPQSGMTQQPQQGDSGTSVGPLNTSAVKQAYDYATRAHKQPAPPPIKESAKQPGLAAQIGMNALNMFVPFVGGAVQQHVKAERQSQINDVVNKLGTLYNELEMADYVSGGDEQKKQQYLQQSSQSGPIKALFDDKKFRKGMQKVFGADLLNPDKQNTVYHEGIKKFLQIRPAADKIKQSLERLMQFHQGQQGQEKQQPQQGQPKPGGGQQEQPQQSPEQMAQAVSKLPQKLQLPDMASAEKSAMTYKNLMEASLAEVPATEFKAWAKSFHDDNKRWPNKDEIAAFHEAVKLRPSDQLVEEALADYSNGDMQSATEKLKFAHDIANAVHATPHQTLTDMLYGASQGNKKDLDAYHLWLNSQIQRAEAYGKGRAKYLYQPFMVDGQMVMKSMVDIANDNAMGKDVGLPIGRFTTTQLQAYQRLANEAGPRGSKFYANGAMKGIYENIKAYDNGKDRLIFAKAFAEAKKSSGALVGDSMETMKNVLNQIAIDDLSPEGKNLYTYLKRMNETMGLFRQASGLPSTDLSMELTLGLMPGAQTPSSEMARKQIDSLNQMILNMQTSMFGQNALPGQKDDGKPKQSFQDWLNSSDKPNAPR